MDKIPFGVYDFFAYLSSGAILLVTADYILSLGLLGQKDVGVTLGLVLIIFAYVSGQVVAHFASLVLERFVVGRILKRPTSVLLGEPARSRILIWIFPGYYRALPAGTRDRICQRARARGVGAQDESLFLHVYAVVTSGSERTQGRLDEFRNQYGFARNVGFAFFLASIAVIVGHRLSYHPVRLRWAILAGLVSVTLFYRYLKFLRQYSYELLLRYAELPLSGPKCTAEEG